MRSLRWFRQDPNHLAGREIDQHAEPRSLDRGDGGTELVRCIDAGQRVIGDARPHSGECAGSTEIKAQGCSCESTSARPRTDLKNLVRRTRSEGTKRDVLTQDGYRPLALARR